MFGYKEYLWNDGNLKGMMLMVYVERDSTGKICAIHNQKTPACSEEDLNADNPEVIEFVMSSDKESHLKFLITDLQMIRVLENVINILMDKNIITTTDFPQPVIDKLMARQAFRKRYTGVAGMEYNEDEKT